MLTTVLLVAAHVVHVGRAGALWRDEAHELRLATMPTFGELWAAQEFFSYPLAWQVVLRSWIAVAVGHDATERSGDFLLRVLGAAVGIAGIAAMWSAARSLGVRWPVLLLATLGCSPALLLWGDSLRAYGWGVLTTTAMTATVARFVEEPTRRRFVAAAVASLVAVQSVHYGSILLLALGIGSVAVSVARRRLVPGVPIVMVGAVCAASLVPYLPGIRAARGWQILLPGYATAAETMAAIVRRLGSDEYQVQSAAWLACAAFALLAHFRAFRRSPVPAWREAGLFWLVATAFGVFGYVAFLVASGYHVQPWHVLALQGFVALSAQVGIARWGAEANWPNPATVVVAAALGVLGAAPLGKATNTRLTNVDQIADVLRAQAAPADVVVATKFEYAPSIARYLRGPAALLTLPPLTDPSLCRFDLAKQQMQTPGAMQPVLRRIEQTLDSGGSVWLIGRLAPLPEGYERNPGAEPPPPPLPDTGWKYGPYEAAWSRQLTYALLSRNPTVTVVVEPPPPSMGFEGLPLVRVSLADRRE